MKKLISLVMLLVLLAQPVLAAGQSRLSDEADLLTAREARQLQEQLDVLSETWNLEVRIVTVASLQGRTAQACAEAYGSDIQNGIVLLVAAQEREYWFSTFGSAQTIFTYTTLEYIEQAMLPLLSENAFYEAFEVFADQCEKYLASKSHMPTQESFPVLKSLGISLLLGLVLALVITGIMRSQLKSVRSKSGAGDYVVSGSLVMTQVSDLYLYSHVSRVARPKDQSSGGSHRGGSGRSRGGGRGGKF